MKRLLPPMFCMLLALSLWVQAEPAHKPQNKPAQKASASVDLEAAAKATAALYANMAAPTAQATPAAVAPAPTPPATPAATAQALSAKPFTPARPARPSPLLPEAASTTVVPVVASSPEPAAAAAAGEVWAGAYQCEHAEKVSMRPGQGPDMVELQWKAQRWQMRRIDSRSGAMRLEDASARMVWIQLPNKSMLLDQRHGRRLLDECQHDVQVQTAAQMKNNPPPALFDTRGMGR